MTWYIYDELKVYTSEQEHTKGNPIPYNSTDKEPPALKDGEFAIFTNGEWIVASEYPTPEPEPIQVPQTITPRQFRLQLLALNLLDEVEAMATTDKATQIWFEYSLDFQRNNEMLIASATALGLGDEDMDTFFIEANKL